MDKETVTSTYAREMMRVNEEVLSVALDAVVGHKKQLMDQGFDERVAEAMCIAYHQVLIHKLFYGK